MFVVCRRPASVTPPIISTIWCFRPYNPYIFCEIWSWQHVSVICSVFIAELSPVYCCLVRMLCHFNFCRLAAWWLTQMVTHPAPFSLQLITNVLHLQSAGPVQSETTKGSPDSPDSPRNLETITRINRRNHQNYFNHSFHCSLSPTYSCSQLMELKVKRQKGQTWATWQEAVVANLAIRGDYLKGSNKIIPLEKCLKQQFQTFSAIWGFSLGSSR